MTKKLRFEVFKRDSFTCKYCGRKPSEEAVLEVDHIIPKSQGGLDEIENLLTSCFDCNRGKGKRMLNELTPEIQKNADLLKERKEQLKEFYKYQKDIEKLTNEAIGIVSEYWSELTDNQYSLSPTAKITIKNFLKTFTIQEIKEAMEISIKIDNIEQRFKYFCGVMHNKRLEKNDPKLHDLIKYWKSKQKGSGYYKKEGLEVLLHGRESSGHYEHGLEGSKEIIDVVFAKQRSSYYGTLVDYLNDEKYINDEVNDFWDRQHKEEEKRKWDEIQRENEQKNPLLFQAINHYTFLTNDYDIGSFIEMFKTLINTYGINDTLKIITFSVISDTSYGVLLDFVHNNVQRIKEYEKWLTQEYKSYLTLCAEAREIKETDDIKVMEKVLLLLATQYSIDDAKGMMWYVASVKGELIPEHFKNLDALYKDYIEEEKSIGEFFERKAKLN